MSDQDNKHIQEHIKVYLTVFGALGVLTLLTVAASYMDVSTTETIFLALTIATVKASLVAGYFMHLINEKQTIIWILCLTFVFFLFCMFIPMITSIDHTSLS
ncbi:MAG: cytochrome C oxidase subunit IV family protein [Candidatus Neomarinimicrobiota bacterium]|nr:cytochrome C oxidase subunit IV family protein [Candidatus Neomarinimicrobiota bacterium]